MANGFLSYEDLSFNGRFPAIHIYQERFVQDFQEFKSSKLLNLNNYLSKNIITSGNLDNNTFYFERRN
jgi:hypothetical protein